VASRSTGASIGTAGVDLVGAGVAPTRAPVCRWARALESVLRVDGRAPAG
jgi:hypothetical protein